MRGERRGHSASYQSGGATQNVTKKPASERLRALSPDIWALVRPRRRILGLGLVLIAINRVFGLVLPASTKFLIDNVIGKHQASMLVPLTMAVVGATAIQGVTSFSLTQLLSIEGQKLIAELRRRVQEHIGRLLGRILRFE